MAEPLKQADLRIKRITVASDGGPSIHFDRLTDEELAALLDSEPQDFTDEEVPVGPDRDDEPNGRWRGPAPIPVAGLREDFIERLTRTRRQDWDDGYVALLSEPVQAGLDVERLARAIVIVDLPAPDSARWQKDGSVYPHDLANAEAIAAEYARLASKGDSDAG